MGQDETPKKKLKRDHPHKDHAKAKSPSESKPKKSEPKKQKKAENKSPSKASSRPPEERKSSPAKEKKEKQSSKSEDATELLAKPGQKHPEPSLEDPTRAFYESLYEQNPNSHMAQKYCLEYGLLPEDTAAKILEALKKKAK